MSRRRASPIHSGFYSGLAMGSGSSTPDAVGCVWVACCVQVPQSYNIEFYYFTGFCNDVLLTGYVPATKNSQFNREENNPRFQHSRDSKCYDSVHLFETLWAGLWYLHAFVLFS